MLIRIENPARFTPSLIYRSDSFFPMPLHPFLVQQAVPEIDNPVKVLQVPRLVRDHHDGLLKLAVHGPEVFKNDL